MVIGSVNCRICKGEIKLEWYDFVYFNEKYWLDRGRRFTHGECWDRIKLLGAKARQSYF